MGYALGNRVIRKLCEEQNPLAWQRAKLSPVLFKPYEQTAYGWVANHLKNHHVLPKVETLVQEFPDMAALDVPEPSGYYLQHLEQQYFYERINKANLDSQEILKQDPANWQAALKLLSQCQQDITAQRYRLRILDVASEVGPLVMDTYHKVHFKEDALAIFGWPYMDMQFGGVMPGEVVSFVGRPAAGKTWKMLWSAMKNWRDKHINTLFCSMEMSPLPIAQRIAALYTGLPIQQLKTSGFSQQTWKKFYSGMQTLDKEQTKFYVIDGNLAASVEEIFALAQMLNCPLVFIDGAYLLRHPNPRLDRFTRAAENVEWIKRQCTDRDMTAFCSWQFNRIASQKQKKGGSDIGDIEDIGYSDAIGQISAIVLGLFQEDSVETLHSRKIRVLKGRNGEIGQFSIEWAFDVMSFQQSDPPLSKSTTTPTTELQWL